MKKFLQLLFVALTLLLSSQNLTEAKQIEFVQSVVANKVSEKDLHCLAKTIYHEANTEPLLGKYAVAYTTINRALHPKYPGSICAVVRQPGQYSWFGAGKWRVSDSESYKEALSIARYIVETFRHELDPTNGATMFHAKHVKPKWNWKKLRKTAKIGDHVFYAEV